MAIHYAQTRRIVPSLQDDAIRPAPVMVDCEGRAVDVAFCADKHAARAHVEALRAAADDGVDGSDSIGDLVYGFFSCVRTDTRA